MFCERPRSASSHDKNSSTSIGTDSVLHVYLATGLSHVGQETHGPEEDHMEVFELRFDEAVAMVVSGEIADAKSTIGLLLADRRLRGLDSVVK